MKATASLYEFMPYGAPELLQFRRERMARALVLSSTTAVAICAAASFLSTWMASAPIQVPRASIEIRIIDQAPPPLNPRLPSGIASPRTGRIPIPAIPLPVPEVAIPNDQTFAAPSDNTGVAPQPTSETGGLASQQMPGDTLPGPDDFVYVEELPVAITRVVPTYSDVAREAGVEGVVVVAVLVGRDGRVLEARLDKKRQVPLLNDAALAAARRWVFKPALANNRPVAVWTAIPFNFELHAP